MKSYLNDSIVLSPDQFQILLGTGLGDGHFSRRSSGNTYFITNCRLSSGEYLEWKYQELGSTGLFVRGPHLGTHSSFRLGRVRVVRERWLLTSRRHPFLNQFRDLFYPAGKKVVTREILSEISPLGLAVWFMDDGNLSVWGKDGRYSNLRLCTQSFTYQEHVTMREWFIDKWKLPFRINRSGSKGNKWGLVLSKKDYVNGFLEMVAPHINVSCMRYKLGSLYLT